MKDPVILVVDDNPDHRELTVMALAECCAPELVATLGDGAEALDWLLARGAHTGRRGRPLPRLVLLDLKLMRLSGVDVLRAMRVEPRTAAVPVLIHSSSTESSDIAACYAAGANGYVGKATDFDELRRRMRHAFDFWLGVNEAAR